MPKAACIYQPHGGVGEHIGGAACGRQQRLYRRTLADRQGGCGHGRQGLPMGGSEGCREMGEDIAVWRQARDSIGIGADHAVGDVTCGCEMQVGVGVRGEHDGKVEGA
jgi:hypothetical protein